MVSGAPSGMLLPRTPSHSLHPAHCLAPTTLSCCTSAEAALAPSMVAVAAVLCFLLLGFFIALCMYRRKFRGEAESRDPARPVAGGSFLPIPLQCCAGTPSSPRFVLIILHPESCCIHLPYPGFLSHWSSDFPQKSSFTCRHIAALCCLSLCFMGGSSLQPLTAVSEPSPGTQTLALSAFSVGIVWPHAADPS